MTLHATSRSAALRRNALPIPDVAARLRMALTLLFLVAFTLQGFVAQTHVHDISATQSVALTLAGETASGPATTKLPLHMPLPDNPAKCPLCHFATSLNSAIAVATTLIILPISGLAVLPSGPDLSVPKAPPSFVWRNRGPPQA